MKNKARLALAVLALSMLACGLPSLGRQPSAPTTPSPTPPPIPTLPPLTPTLAPEPTGTPEQIISPNQIVPIIYGSARSGNMALHFLTVDGLYCGKLDMDEEVVRHAIWPDVAPDGSRVAFVSVQSTLLSNGIYIANIDGSNITQLTEGDGMYPRWSPDGTRIAYACNDNSDICVISMADLTVTNLTADSEAVDTYPEWTPDGQIVFMSARDLPTNGRFSEIYIMNADGTEATALTSDGDAYNANPTVSPDGKQIAFESDRDVGIGSEIYVMKIDGSNQVRITNDSAWNQNPAWSPDGNVIMFAANYGDGNIDLYYINTDGSNRVRLTQHPGEDGGFRWGHAWLPVEYIPAWLEVENDPRSQARPPRGSEPVTNAVIFATNSFNCPDCLETGIYTVNFDGSNLIRLPIDGLYPAWGPAFRRLAFVSNGELWLANADGSGPVQMTHAYRQLYGLTWGDETGDILAGCTPYGQHDACQIDPETGVINNLLEEITYGSGIPYPSWYNEESFLLGTLQIDLLGQVVSSLPFGGRISPPIGTDDRLLLATIVDRQLVVMNPDGTGQLKLTNDSPTKGFPVWSPDGQLVAYSAAPGDGHVYLYIVKADGSVPPNPLVARPIAAGPTARPEVLETYYGYNWAP
jgi:Tol biopolymer transport system component